MSGDPVDVVIVELNAFQPSDDDFATENLARIYDTLRNFRSLPQRERAMPAMFALLERFPNVDLGSPGPIVHELEAIKDTQGRPAYLHHLRDSLGRQPTVWMVDRVLNIDLPNGERASWLVELTTAYEHALASEETRRSAVDFLQHQARR